MIERKDKRYVSCPVCGRHLMKCQGQCSIDITCGKCNRQDAAELAGVNVSTVTKWMQSGEFQCMFCKKV